MADESLADLKYFDHRKFYFEDGTLREPLPQCAMEDLEKLITIVLNKHFSKVRPDKKEDLKQQGWAKVFKTFRQGQFDPNISSLKNYLYTGIRNEMGNFLVKNQKEELLDNNLIEGGFLQEYDEDGAPLNEGDDSHEQTTVDVVTEYVIHKKDIEEVVNRFTRIENLWDRLSVYFSRFGIDVDFGNKVGSDDDEEGGEIAAIASLCIWRWRRING